MKGPPPKPLLPPTPPPAVTVQPAIPNAPIVASNPKKHAPPDGIEGFQMAKEGNYWSVWAFRVKEGAVQVEKILEREIFDLCRQKVLTETIGYQIRAIR